MALLYKVEYSYACPSFQECRSAGVECIVAPYEADSQLAYLSKEEIVDLVITEDSDLLVFGCRKVYTLLYVQLPRRGGKE